jgi:hypothetical protein
LASIVLLAAGLVLVALPWMFHRLGRSIAPRDWVPLCSAALGAGTAVVEGVLLLYASPTVLGALGLHAAAAVCARVAGGAVPGGAVAGWSAFALAATLAAAVLTGGTRSLIGARRLRRLSEMGERTSYDTWDLVVIDHAEPLALSVAGRRPLVLLSRALANDLGPAGVDVVVAHELAHLRAHHHRHLCLAGAVSQALGFLWPVRRSVAVLREALERAADEEAAGDSLARRQTLGRALLVAASERVPAGAASLSPVDTVLDRVDALASAPHRPPRWKRIAIYLPGATLTSVAWFALVCWVPALVRMATTAGRCSI